MPATIDLQAVQSVEHPERGIARFVGDLVAALEAEHAASIAAYVYNPALPLPVSVAGLARAGRLVSAADLRRHTGSVHLVASPFEGVGFDQIVPPATRLGPAATAVILYDLIPLRYPEQYLSDPVARRRYLARTELVRNADAVLAISEQTARDAHELLGVSSRRLHVVGGAPSDAFGPPDDVLAARVAARRVVPGLQENFVLCPGGADWRKNLPALVEAWAGIGRAHGQLVITGHLRHVGDELLHAADQLGIADRILLPGRTTDDQLALLYQAARLVVFPSRFEGYGLPVMEARRSGTPVLASRTSSLVELLPDDALFDPTDPAAITTAMTRTLDDPVRLERLRNAPIPDEHTWPAVAARTITALDALPGRARARARRRQVAVVSPLPPVPSGVADHSLRLLEALRHHADVHAFTDSLDLVRAPEGVGLHRLDHLGRAGASRGQFDAVVHCWGNSETHASMLPVMRTWPGIVLAHDVAVAGLYDRCSTHAPELVDHASFPQLLRRAYGDQLPSELRGRNDSTYLDADRLGLTMAGEVIDTAERYLTHSTAAAELARNARPEQFDRIAVVPFAYPPARPPAHPERVGDPPIIATFGIVNLVKRVDTVLDAFVALGSRHPTAVLAFVGDVGHGLRQELERSATRRRVADRVVFTGRVPQETYDRWLSIADVAVQLRRNWGGEASAAIADALAWGIPTIVSDIGWAKELPAAAVRRLPGEASAPALADAVHELLTDADQRVRLSRAATDHAATQGFDRLAEALMQFVVT